MENNKVKSTRGRKPEPDKKKAVTIYVRKSKIKQFGNESKLKKELLKIVE